MKWMAWSIALAGVGLGVVALLGNAVYEVCALAILLVCIGLLLLAWRGRK